MQNEKKRYNLANLSVNVYFHCKILQVAIIHQQSLSTLIVGSNSSLLRVLAMDYERASLLEAILCSCFVLVSISQYMLNNSYHRVSKYSLIFLYNKSKIIQFKRTKIIIVANYFHFLSGNFHFPSLQHHLIFFIKSLLLLYFWVFVFFLPRTLLLLQENSLILSSFTLSVLGVLSYLLHCFF